ncbi:hypothetical protein ABIA38_008587, partial [Embleya sp. AB8]
GHGRRGPPPETGTATLRPKPRKHPSPSGA